MSPGQDIERGNDDNVIEMEEHNFFSEDFLDEAMTFNGEPIERAEERKIAKHETRRVSQVRLAVFFALMLATGAVSTVMYISTRDAETRRFQLEYEDNIMDIQIAFHDHIRAGISSLDNTGIVIQSAITPDKPFVSMNDWPARSASALHLAGGSMMAVLPVVRADQREEWEAFALDPKHNSWINNTEKYIQEQERVTYDSQSGYRKLQAQNNKKEALGIAQGFPSSIYRFEGSKVVPQDQKKDAALPPSSTFEDQVAHFKSSSYLPMWMHGPFRRPIVNFDALSHPLFAEALTNTYVHQQLIIGSPTLMRDNYGEPSLIYDCLGTDDPEICNQPASVFASPILVDDGVDEYGAPATRVAAIAALTVFWKDQLQATNIPASAEGIYCVLENECGATLTYRVGHEGKIEYIGPADFHEAENDDKRVVITIGQILNIESGREDIHMHHKEIPYIYSPGLSINADYCPLKLSLYPSVELVERYRTKTPVYYTILVIGVFLLTSCVFLAYDCMVERRQTVVMKTATESSAIVSGLFPEVVRDRLFANRSEDASESNSNINDCMVLSHGKMAILNGHGGIMPTSKPIADLFHDTTVLFADIAGFTKWSSAREPTEVFQLLEAIFNIFDRIATRRRVFKIETIGDCYLAVTGLPESQEDHAVRMSLFAFECLRSMQQLTRMLSATFGEDTADLAIRTGMHSGKVTAGVLRGDKSRFQLFGDTVNTASRMESNGARDKIQVSQATADLLASAGKGHWLAKRKDLVAAKGKGDMQTYWIQFMKDHKLSVDKQSSENNSVGATESIHSV